MITQRSLLGVAVWQSRDRPSGRSEKFLDAGCRLLLVIISEAVRWRRATGCPRSVRVARRLV